MANVICLKVSNLRKKGFENLKEWMENPNNVYTGRGGRIWIWEDELDEQSKRKKYMFHYRASKWHNPFTLKDYGLKKSLDLYVKHLFQTGLIYQIDELRGKTLGCFCVKQKVGNEPMCHAQILADLLDRCYKPIKNLIKCKQQEMKSNPENKNPIYLMFYSKSKDDKPGSPTFNNTNIPLNWRKQLSNFWEEHLEIDGDVYPSAEHYFHAMKVQKASSNPNKYKKFTIEGDIDTPLSAKKAGGKKGFQNMRISLDAEKWNKLRNDVQSKIIEARYQQHPVYKEIMDEIGKIGAVLRHFDRSGVRSYWGGNVDRATGKWVGRNRLGNMMTEYTRIG